MKLSEDQHADENYDFNFEDKFSKQTILSDAPLAGYDEQFNTMALKVPSNSIQHPTKRPLMSDLGKSALSTFSI